VTHLTSADVTRRELSLGSLDSVTGWYAKNFDDSTIKMVIRPRGQSVIGLPVGQYAKYDVTGFVVDVVEEGDEIVDAQGSYYEIKAVEEEWFLDSFSHRVCNLVKVPIHYDMPASYGTPPTVQDARQRTKVYLDAYLDEEELGVTFITCWANPPYPLKRVFVTKGVDLVFCIGTPDSVALPVGVGYIENVPITIFAIDKTSVMGNKLRWKAEAELRRIVETYPLGSLRTLTRMRDNEQNLGSTTLYSVTDDLRYKRYS